MIRRATSSEKNTAMATVRPNCLKYCPAMPLMNDTGDKHRDDRRGDGDHGQTDFVGRLHRGAIGRFAHADVADDVFDFDNRIIDQNAGHQRDAEQADTRLSEKPIRSITQNVGMTDSGSATAEISVARQSRRNRNTTMTASTAPSTSDAIAAS